tara:strand:- start:738 stop:938 length:201 start_codon:yes stop_codon:yes gene_type:complete
MTRSTIVSYLQRPKRTPDAGGSESANTVRTVSHQIAIAAAATLVSLAFAATVFERWLDRRRPQDLA